MYLLKNKRKLIFLLTISLFASSCIKQEKQTANNTFYNFDSLVNAQVNYLRNAPSVLHKEASIDDKNETINITMADSAEWSEELDVFRQLDLVNKPIFRNEYEVSDGLHDIGSNLIIREFKARKKEKVPLPFLRIYYEGTINNIRKVEGLYNEKNALYAASRKLSMELNNVYNKTILTSYSISGGQKMILADTVLFRVTGTISHPERSE